MSEINPIVLQQGSDFILSYQLTVGDIPLRLAGWSARMQIRSGKTSASPLLWDIPSGSGASYDLGTGLVTIELPAAATASFVVPEPDPTILFGGLHLRVIGYYSIEFYQTAGPAVQRIREGRVYFSSEIAI